MDKILIVEDDEIVRENLFELLSNEGYECTMAIDGLEATQIIKGYLPDLILCDLMMPRIDGFEFFELFQSLNNNTFIPFIFLTAKTDPHSVQHAMGKGADDFIFKPFKAQELLERIESRLKKKRSINKNFDQLKINVSMYVPHELKTPLISILGYTELLLSDYESYSNSDIKEMLSSIQHSGLRLKNRIEKFVTYLELKLASENPSKSKVEYIDPSEHNCKDQLEECFECRKRISDIEIQFDKGKIELSQVEFQSMMLELVENACKFSDIGTKILVSGKSHEEKYEITVSNIGPKLDSSVLESFYQENKSYYQQNGNGIGLAIVKMIAKKNRGNIIISNDEMVSIRIILHNNVHKNKEIKRLQHCSV